MAGTALVTGGSGYIAGFLIRQLIGNGWTVHATVRNLKREPEVRGWLDVDNDKLQFFAADLEHDAGWAEAIAGCTHVAHIASPFPVAVPKDADELVVPAREGALRALRFARAAGIKRFVLTSSMAAIAYGHGKGVRMNSEADWTNLADPNVMPYIRSKTVAEHAARDWMAAEGDDMEFASVNPAAVFGPLLSDDLADLDRGGEAIARRQGAVVPRCRFRHHRCARCRRPPLPRADRRGDQGRALCLFGPVPEDDRCGGHSAREPWRTGAQGAGEENA